MGPEGGQCNKCKIGLTTLAQGRNTEDLKNNCDFCHFELSIGSFA